MPQRKRQKNRLDIGNMIGWRIPVTINPKTLDILSENYRKGNLPKFIHAAIEHYCCSLGQTDQSNTFQPEPDDNPQPSQLKKSAVEAHINTPISLKTNITLEDKPKGTNNNLSPAINNLLNGFGSKFRK